MQKMDEKIKEIIDGFINSINPCGMCEHEERETSRDLEACKVCCFYYSSKFDVKEGGDGKQKN